MKHLDMKSFSNDMVSYYILNGGNKVEIFSYWSSLIKHVYSTKIRERVCIESATRQGNKRVLS